jgi:hypothetical protein
MHKFFILINVLYSSTRFGHYYAHLQEDNCIIIAFGIVSLLGDCSVHRLRVDSRNLWSKQSPKESDDTRLIGRVIRVSNTAMYI